jgi:polysaccharide export outer membrane protein
MKTREAQNETADVTIWFRAIRHPKLRAHLTGLALLASAAGLSGCASSHTSLGPVEAPPAATAATADAILEGDTLKIAFVGAPALDTTQEVRRDGRISLPVAGEVQAAGMRPAELAAQLSQLFASELLSNEVVVTVVASSFDVNVSGAVLRPGKIASKRQMTALEAVMEAGGFDHAKANVKRVVVIRRDGPAESKFVLDLSLPLEGKQSQPFFLQPSDIVYVPERFVWF